MSRLPHENRNVVDRPDLQEYELNKACPVTGEMTGLENHHLWPRSFGTKSWWVELWDGSVVGNRIALSQEAHHLVTVNKARIEYDDGLFYWVGEDSSILLRWQPPNAARQVDPEFNPDYVMGPGDEVPRLATTGERNALGLPATDYSVGVHAKIETLTVTEKTWAEMEVHEGEPCPTCKRRIPHAKKESSPKTKVFSTRVPIDDADVFSELVDAAAEHHGLKSRPHHRYWVLLFAVTLLLQQEPGELPVG